ncbi:MATE family efflux transporter [Actinomadura flavalba]|uniref:MATE family efflux transporter n=1 Tax=Actinomadura flavalba TaxID=1120938 RepID=UPI00037A0B95|nr:MATE family efflux transporter [Actinomadura flavalba]
MTGTVLPDRAPPGMRPLWALAYPLMVAGLTQIVLNVVDTILLGRLSTRALAAFALAAPVYLVALVVVRGWATAVQVRVAQRHGAGRPGEVAQVVRVGVVTSVAAGAVVGALLWVLATPVLRVLGASGDLLGPGTAYLRVLAFAVPFAAVSFTLQGACAGVGATRAAMYTALLVNAVNLPAGLLLIFHVGWGVPGAAAATLLATAAGTAFLLLYARPRLPRNADAAPGVTRDLWTIGWPEMSTMGVGYVNEALIAGFAARMGTHDLAAYRIVDNLLLIVFTILASAATATTILAGQDLGAADPAQAESRRRTGTRLLLLMLAIPSALILLAGTTLPALFTEDPAVADQAWQATPWALLSMLPMVVAMTYAALLRAAGNTRAVMIASIASDYLVLIPLAWLLGVHLGYGLHGLYLSWTAFALTYTALLALHHHRSR